MAKARYAGWLKESPHPAVHPLHPVERNRHVATVRAFCSGLPVTYRTGATPVVVAMFTNELLLPLGSIAAQSENVHANTNKK